MPAALVSLFRLFVVLLSAMALLGAAPRLELETHELASDSSSRLISSELPESHAATSFRDGPAWRKKQPERERLASPELEEQHPGLHTGHGARVFRPVASATISPPVVVAGPQPSRWSARSARGPPRG